MDCFHHRVIYSTEINTPIKDWSVIPYDFAGCHSIAGDGQIYVVDNGGNHQVTVFDASLKKVQTIETPKIKRPHRVLYDDTTNLFYVYGAFSQTLVCYKNESGKLVEQYSKVLDFLEGYYCRSVNIIDGYMYFVSTQGKIFKINYLGAYEVAVTYIMPPELVSLVDVNKIGNYYYVSVMGDKLVRTLDLNTLSGSAYENMYDYYGLLDKPYFVSYFDSKIYFTEVGEVQNSIIEVNPNDMHDFKIIYRVNGITEEDINRRELYPR